MGNRAHARIDFPSYNNEGITSSLYIYTHWDGPERLLGALTDAVASEPARARVGDDEYFTRIVVQRTLNDLGADPNRDTGYGLGVTIPDGPLVAVVNARTGELRKEQQ